MPVNRRAFITACIAAPHAISETKPITAREVIERIQKNVGVPWRDKTVDTFKTGNPDTIVKGIATRSAAHWM